MATRTKPERPEMVPFKMAGNLYFVGTYPASSHLIDTGDGLILIDVGYEHTGDIVLENMKTLGFDAKDVKYILLSHGHYDHSDGVPKILAHADAQVLLGEEELRYIKGFTPTRYYKDGEVVTLGNTSIRCVHTPGHTMGTYSFFWDMEVDGKTVRAGMFGGAGTNQLKKSYLDPRGLSYQQRRHFFETLDLLRGEKVELMVGNHAWNNDTYGKYLQLATAESNPFVDNGEQFLAFLDQCEQKLMEVFAEEHKTEFVNYAHRGASEYNPENTLLSFYNGISMGANGIETDVQRTKDGKLVLFHDDTLLRATGQEGVIADYTFEELQEFRVRHEGLEDKIVLFEEFLQKFGWRDLTFAIELKVAGCEQDVADLIRKYDLVNKMVVTSFKFDYIAAIKAYAPELRVGYLTKEDGDDIVEKLIAIDASEICPLASAVTAEKVDHWHRKGLRVRAWGVTQSKYMKGVYDAGADGMTVNFPDWLTRYIGRIKE